jgi:uncharacterized membrane protein
LIKVYLLLTVLGIAIPFGAFIPWLATNGLDVIALFNAAIVNPISIFAWLDVIVAALVLLIFIIVDGKQNKVKNYWFAIVGTLSVGVSFGLPLYLYLKEKQRILLKEP